MMPRCMIAMDGLRITVCICTNDRPAELERCLMSIGAGTALPAEVIVSDDTREASVSETIRDVCARYDYVRYEVGPRRGLCRNRNAVIAAARTSHVSLLDDDGIIGPQFIERAVAAISEHPDRIFTGDVIESGIGHCIPTNPTRWGHFGKPVGRGEGFRNVQLNCNIFPRQAFFDAAFDERLVYGYEDTDLCDRLVRRGWRIDHCPHLVNEHQPPSRGDRTWQAERERFVVLFRIRSKADRLRPRAIPWVVLAPLHALVAYARRGCWSWIPRVPAWTLRGAWLAARGPSPPHIFGAYNE
jgi:GT2 family glycosyltransferase